MWPLILSQRGLCVKSVEVRFHLPLETIGSTESTIHLDPQKETTVEKVLGLIGERYPSFKRKYLPEADPEKKRVPSVWVAINGSAALMETPVREGDTVEIFLVIGGG